MSSISHATDTFLSQWIKAPLPKEQTYQLDFSSDAIYAFGRYDRQAGANKEQLLALRTHGMEAYHGFLSNYHPAVVQIACETFASVEHYYQSQKCLDKPELYKKVKEAPSSNTARKVARASGKSFTFDEKVEVMKRGLAGKFLGPDGKASQWGKMLLATGDSLLVEGNRRSVEGAGDKVWGAIYNAEYTEATGRNLLGCFLMELREHLKKR